MFYWRFLCGPFALGFGVALAIFTQFYVCFNNSQLKNKLLVTLVDLDYLIVELSGWLWISGRFIWAIVDFMLYGIQCQDGG